MAQGRRVAKSVSAYIMKHKSSMQYLKRKTIMLGVLASIALIVGGVQTAMVLSEEDRLAAEENQPAVVQIQIDGLHVPSILPAAE